MTLRVIVTSSFFIGSVVCDRPESARPMKKHYQYSQPVTTAAKKPDEGTDATTFPSPLTSSLVEMLAMLTAAFFVANAVYHTYSRYRLRTSGTEISSQQSRARARRRLGSGADDGNDDSNMWNALMGKFSKISELKNKFFPERNTSLGNEEPKRASKSKSMKKISPSIDSILGADESTEYGGESMDSEYAQSSNGRGKGRGKFMGRRKSNPSSIATSAISEDGDSIASESVFSESAAESSVFSESIYSESGDTGSVYSESVYSGSGFSGSVYSGSVFSKSMVAESRGSTYYNSEAGSSFQDLR